MELAMRRPARADERGMSLVEILVALTILALAVLSLMPLFLAAIKTAASANQLTNANTLVREKLEELAGYPRGDARLAVPVGADTASFTNDLPSWYNPSTGIVSFATTSPGAGWYPYPYFRTYTVEQFAADLTTRVTTPVGGPAPYIAKLVTVNVRPTQWFGFRLAVGPFLGLRETTQSLYLRFPNG
jgi:prepilin-type N-terminal cleavage/methylation domain-containing protein